jgi:hypothetical protein
MKAGLEAALNVAVDVGAPLIRPSPVTLVNV